MALTTLCRNQSDHIAAVRPGRDASLVIEACHRYNPRRSFNT